MAACTPSRKPMKLLPFSFLFLFLFSSLLVFMLVIALPNNCKDLFSFSFKPATSISTSQLQGSSQSSTNLSSPLKPSKITHYNHPWHQSLHPNVTQRSPLDPSIPTILSPPASVLPAVAPPVPAAALATQVAAIRKTKSKRSKMLRAVLKSLQPTRKSQRFPARAREFIANSSCNASKMIFFMTWISPLDSFTTRELLAVESLFKAHKDARLIFLSATLGSPGGWRLLQPFQSHGFRVAALSPDYFFLLRGTPAERWFHRLAQGLVAPGSISLGQNLSNLIRLAVLHKYGGTYLDTDVIVIRSFLRLANTIGTQSMEIGGNWTRLNNAVLVFDKVHPILMKFMSEYVKSFDGSKWGHNGPYLVTRVVQREGREKSGVTVLGLEAFYPVGWETIDKWERRWVEERVSWVLERSYGLHLWNRETRMMVVEKGNVVERIMSERCLFCNYSYSYSSPL